MMTAAQVLAEAAKLVAIERNADHGPARQNLGLVAKFWSAYLGSPIEAADVAEMMVLLKLARARTGAPVLDHFVDMAGYAGLAGALALDADEAPRPVGVSAS